MKITDCGIVTIELNKVMGRQHLSMCWPNHLAHDLIWLRHAYLSSLKLMRCSPRVMDCCSASTGCFYCWWSHMDDSLTVHYNQSLRSTRVERSNACPLLLLSRVAILTHVSVTLYPCVIFLVFISYVSLKWKERMQEWLRKNVRHWTLF